VGLSSLFLYEGISFFLGYETKLDGVLMGVDNKKKIKVLKSANLLLCDNNLLISCSLNYESKQITIGFRSKELRD